ncbi:MAG: molecular chaperone TorD family protein [bacterium]
MSDLDARIAIYEILSSAFSRPGRDLAMEILYGRLARRINGILKECCESSAGCCLPTDLLDQLRSLSPPAPEERERLEFVVDLDEEYTRLFINAFPTLRVPPYESYYREKRMMGRAAMECLFLYRSDGLTVRDEGELPDHIVSQLEYLGFLCLAESAAQAGSPDAVPVLRRKQREFYEKHIMTWVPDFCFRVQSHSKIHFYRVMARLMKNFTAIENRNLNPGKLDPFQEVMHDEIAQA